MTYGNDLINPIYSSTSDVREAGLTKRELFAAMAMQGFISNSRLNPDDVGYEPYANDAVKFADALIDALNDKP